MVYEHKCLVSSKLHRSNRKWHCNKYVKLLKLNDSDNNLKSAPDMCALTVHTVLLHPFDLHLTCVHCRCTLCFYTHLIV